jgi:hypothetical protein
VVAQYLFLCRRSLQSFRAALAQPIHVCVYSTARETYLWSIDMLLCWTLHKYHSLSSALVMLNRFEHAKLCSLDAGTTGAWQHHQHAEHGSWADTKVGRGQDESSVPPSPPKWTDPILNQGFIWVSFGATRGKGFLKLQDHTCKTLAYSSSFDTFYGQFNTEINLKTKSLNNSNQKMKKN